MRAIENIPTEEMVALCEQGNRAGYKMVFERFAKPMLNSSLRIVNNLADAEDMVQDAFCDAFGNLHAYNSNAPFEAWLRRIVINKSISFMRRKKHIVIDFRTENLHATAHDTAADEELFSYDLQRVKSAIESLPMNYKTVFNLYVLEGMPQEEIGDMLGLSHGNVRTVYHRAKSKILAKLKEG